MLLFAKLIESARVSSNTLTSTFSAVEELFCRSRHKSVCISVRFVQKEWRGYNILLTTFQANLSTPGLKKSVTTAAKHSILIKGCYWINAYRLHFYQLWVSWKLLAVRCISDEAAGGWTKARLYLFNKSIGLHSVREVDQFLELTWGSGPLLRMACTSPIRLNCFLFKILVFPQGCQLGNSWHPYGTLIILNLKNR